MLIDNPGIAQRVDGWKQISERSHTTVKESSDGNTIVKLGPRGALVDQASALKHIQEEFGVTVPKALTLHKDGDQFLLFMEKVNYVEGQKMLMNAELEPLFWEANEVIKDIRTYLNDKNSMYEGDLGNENWGVKPEAVERWRKTRQPIAREDIIVIDPVRSIN